MADEQAVVELQFLKGCMSQKKQYGVYEDFKFLTKCFTNKIFN